MRVKYGDATLPYQKPRRPNNVLSGGLARPFYSFSCAWFFVFSLLLSRVVILQFSFSFYR